MNVMIIMSGACHSVIFMQYVLVHQMYIYIYQYLMHT